MRYKEVHWPVEAMQVLPGVLEEIAAWCGGQVVGDEIRLGEEVARQRDYILCSIEGEWQILDPKTFEFRYEPDTRAPEPDRMIVISKEIPSS